MTKKILAGIGGVLVVALGYLAISGSETLAIQTEIEIEAPPQVVWDLLVDVDAWADWNPTVNKSSGMATDGATLELTMIGEDGTSDGPRYQPVVTVLEEPSRLHWRAHMVAGFVFTNEKLLELRETDSGTALTHTEQFRGLLVPLFGSKMNEGVAPILTAMNTALKERAESR